MAKLIVTADIHGSKRAWDKITGLLTQDDGLAVAGDLFDTVYGSAGDPDYRPDYIKKNLKKLPCPLYYVYGNCDQGDYVEGFDYQTDFHFDGLCIFLNHGHYKLPDLTDYHIIIEGHSHIPRLDTLMGKVFLNPGSPTHPRIEFGTYAALENRVITLNEFKTDRILMDLDLNDLL